MSPSSRQREVDRQQENEILEEAEEYTDQLGELISPNFAVTYSYQITERLLQQGTHLSLVDLLLGIPNKFLGYLRSKMQSPRLKLLTLVEMIAGKYFLYV